MTDEQSEEFSQDPEVLELQFQAMSEALTRFESTIGDVVEFTPETAIELGMQYILRDAQCSEVGLQRARIIGDTEDIQRCEQALLGTKAIRDSAKKGNFIPVKSFFKKLGDWQLKVGEAFRLIGVKEGKPTGDTVAEYNKTGSAYIRLAQAIPTRGNPYQPSSRIQ